MAKNDARDSDRKKVSISIRIDPDLLAEIDSFCKAGEFIIDRTAFLEVGARRLLAEKRREQDERETRARNRGHK